MIWITPSGLSISNTPPSFPERLRQFTQLPRIRLHSQIEVFGLSHVTVGRECHRADDKCLHAILAQVVKGVLGRPQHDIGVFHRISGCQPSLLCVDRDFRARYFVSQSP